MSGHSKWATIKRQKGAADLKRGLTFTKLGNAITIAVKRGGGVADPNNNFRLRLAIDAARSANMPKENIERAIQRAVAKDEGQFEEVIYEGFAPEGISIIIEAASDNSMRTTSEIKSLFNKEGASFGQPGSVAYQFEQKGRIEIEKGEKSMDDLLNIASEAGAEDIGEIGDDVEITTSFDNLSKVRDNLVSQGLKIKEAEIIRKPLVKVSIDDPQKLKKVTDFINMLEGLDDVQKVYTNLEAHDR